MYPDAEARSVLMNRLMESVKIGCGPHPSGGSVLSGWYLVSWFLKRSKRVLTSLLTFPLHDVIMNVQNDTMSVRNFRAPPHVPERGLLPKRDSENILRGLPSPWHNPGCSKGIPDPPHLEPLAPRIKRSRRQRRDHTLQDQHHSSPVGRQCGGWLS